MPNKTFYSFKILPGDGPLLEKLTQQHRDVIVTNDTMANIAARHNVPVGTVKSRRHRARAALVALREVNV